MSLKRFLIGNCKLSLLSLFVITTISFIGCKTPGALIDPGFKNQAEVYSVKGRNGLMINQKLSFGKYHTLQVKRG